MQVLEVMHYCDVCEELTLATQFVGMVDGKLLSIELCDEHSEILLSDFIDTLDQIGRPYESRPSTSKRRARRKKAEPVAGPPFICECGDSFDTEKSLSLHRHRSSKHK